MVPDMSTFGEVLIFPAGDAASREFEICVTTGLSYQRSVMCDRSRLKQLG